MLRHSLILLAVLSLIAVPIATASPFPLLSGLFILLFLVFSVMSVSMGSTVKITLRNNVSALAWLTVCALLVLLLIVRRYSLSWDPSALPTSLIVTLVVLIPATFVTAIGAFIGRTGRGFIVGMAVGLLILGMIVASLYVFFRDPIRI